MDAKIEISFHARNSCGVTTTRTASSFLPQNGLCIKVKIYATQDDNLKMGLSYEVVSQSCCSFYGLIITFIFKERLLLLEGFLGRESGVFFEAFH